jgi:hypothetical protein
MRKRSRQASGKVDLAGSENAPVRVRLAPAADAGADQPRRSAQASTSGVKVSLERLNRFMYRERHQTVFPLFVFDLSAFSESKGSNHDCATSQRSFEVPTFLVANRPYPVHRMARGYCLRAVLRAP